MKISLINTSLKGGASKSAQRLCLGLEKLDCDINFIVKNRKGYSDKIIQSFYEVEKLNFISKFKRRYFANKFANPNKDYDKFIEERILIGLDKFSFLDSRLDISKLPIIQSSDIINIHWVADFFNYSKFFKIIQQPIFWTLHDEAPYSYGEHYREEYVFDVDGKLIPRPRKTELQNKFEQKIRELKLRYFENVKNLQIIGPSKWICNQSKNSEIFGNFKTHYIPYSINTEIFKYLNKNYSKDIFNLPKDIPTILFVADTFDNNRKGFRFLYEALKLLNDQNLNLLVIGSGDLTKYEFANNQKIFNLGSIKEEIIMSIAYNAADLFIIPSLMDNLPNTAIESVCCGTPVIGFEIGGIPDIVENGVNGYLSKIMSAESLSQGIKMGIDNLSSFNNLQISELARNKYKLEIQASKYLELFESVR